MTDLLTVRFFLKFLRDSGYVIVKEKDQMSGIPDDRLVADFAEAEEKRKEEEKYE